MRQVNTAVTLGVGIVGRMGITEHVVTEKVVFIDGLAIAADGERAERFPLWGSGFLDFYGVGLLPYNCLKTK